MIPQARVEKRKGDMVSAPPSKRKKTGTQYEAPAEQTADAHLPAPLSSLSNDITCHLARLRQEGHDGEEVELVSLAYHYFAFCARWVEFNVVEHAALGLYFTARKSLKAPVIAVIPFAARARLSFGRIQEIFAHLEDPQHGTPARWFTAAIIDLDSTVTAYRITNDLVHPTAFQKS